MLSGEIVDDKFNSVVKKSNKLNLWIYWKCVLNKTNLYYEYNNKKPSSNEFVDDQFHPMGRKKVPFLKLYWII